VEHQSHQWVLQLSKENAEKIDSQMDFKLSGLVYQRKHQKNGQPNKVWMQKINVKMSLL